MSCCGGHREQLRTEYSARGTRSPVVTNGRVVFEYHRPGEGCRQGRGHRPRLCIRRVRRKGGSRPTRCGFVDGDAVSAARAAVIGHGGP